MEDKAFAYELVLTVLDKGLLALIVVLAGYKLNKALEGIKHRFSREQEDHRTRIAAITDLTKKLATGSHLISWPAWYATQSKDMLHTEDFAQYDQAMRQLMGELMASQATLAAIDNESFDLLSPFADRLYQLDEDIGKAEGQFGTGSEAERAQARVTLRWIYDRALSFDRELLETVTTLLTKRSGAVRSGGHDDDA